MQPGSTPRVLIISHDVVGARMAGPGIRAWHMAQALAPQQPVTLVAPRPLDRSSPSVRCGDYRWGDAASLAAWLHDVDLVVANGFVLEAHPELARVACPLVLDLYDPVLLENLEQLRASPADQRAARAAADQTLLARQLAAGDFFLCATERQRDLYLGALMLAGRLTPELIDADSQARALIDVVPFGLESSPPVKQAPALRGVLPGIGADDPLLLWTGGLWDWLDPLTLIEAMPQIVARHPATRLVFLAGQHPGNIVTMRMPQRARDLARRLDLLDRHVFFYDEWVPYQRRADFLLEATIAVSLHPDHLETTYAAVRSRFLDHLWAGLPSVVSDGDAAAELVQHGGLGRVVAPGDVAGVAQAVGDLLADDRARDTYRAHALAQVSVFAWERVLQPLMRFCLRPRIMRDRFNQSESVSIPPDESTARVQAAVARLDELWKLQPQELTSEVPLLGEAKRAANSLTRWYVLPIVEQQNAFNAAMTHALQQLAEVVEHLSGVAPQLRDQIAQLRPQIEQLRAHTDQLQHEQAPVHQHIADIEQHLCDIDDAQTLLAERLAQAAPGLEQRP
jgi:glycosyltransferase involved in cell wall biosynthesis